MSSQKKPRLAIDLNYKHIRAITVFQMLYKQRKQYVANLNTKMGNIYASLLSVMNNLSNHYMNDVISHDEYTKLMLSVESILDTYEGLPNPITNEVYKTPGEVEKISVTLSWLEYQTIELVKKCGASTCYDILKLLVSQTWSVGLKQNFSKLMKFYNTVFVPRSVKITSLADGQEPPTLPDVKKYSSYTESVLIGLHGAELYVPVYNKLVVIKGYFRRDPLNIARIGGTLGEKYGKLLDKTSTLKSVSETFRTRYVNQISLRDFLSLDVDQLSRMVEDSYVELKKLLEQPLSHVTEQYAKSKTENKSKLLTLLLLDESHRYAASLISAMGSDDSKHLTEVYKHLHWTVQRIYDEVSKTVDKVSSPDVMVDNEDQPYEVRIDNMRAPEVVKRKARDKLKEIRGSREGNEKATKFLDGLLRIPFGIHRQEKILKFLKGVKAELATQIVGLLSYNESEPGNELASFAEELSVHKDNVVTANNVEKIIELVGTHRPLLQSIRDYSDHESGEYKFAVEFLMLEQRWNTYKVDRQQYMEKVSEKLECIHGQKDAKRKIETLIAQWINGESEGAVFGFQGPPGTGKTSLAKEGLAYCLSDEDGTPRPFVFIALGGSTNGAILEGHSYTYVGSKWGRIVDALMDTKCMNPILYFDELDKVSSTPHGKEITAILTHLTDPQQNDTFMDRYFDGIKLDLSGALIIFSYNDSSLIDPILADRITEINYKHYIKSEKIHIAQNYILPKILTKVGYSASEVIFTTEAIEHILESYVYEAGVRKLKEKLYEIIRELNVRHLHNGKAYPLPFTVTVETVDDILERKSRLTIKTIPKKPQVGWVNGLYATSAGTGGLTVIQVFDTISDHKFSLELTGTLGDVMKESIKCAKTITWRVLPIEIKRGLQDEWKDNPFGLHIHCPEAATPKDGPSAGAAITTAIVSYLCSLPVRNYIAMTGEIDLYGNVHAIGGLQSKIEGAIRAGAKIVLIPREKNGEEWDELSKSYEGKIRIVKVDEIGQVLKLCLINNRGLKFNYGSAVDTDEDPVVEEVIDLIRDLDSKNVPEPTPLLVALKAPVVGSPGIPPLDLPPSAFGK